MRYSQACRLKQSIWIKIKFIIFSHEISDMEAIPDSKKIVQVEKSATDQDFEQPVKDLIINHQQLKSQLNFEASLVRGVIYRQSFQECFKIIDS